MQSEEISDRKMFGVTGKTENVWRDGKCLATANPSRQPTRRMFGARKMFGARRKMFGASQPVDSQLSETANLPFGA